MPSLGTREGTLKSSACGHVFRPCASVDMHKLTKDTNVHRAVAGSSLRLTSARWPFVKLMPGVDDLQIFRTKDMRER